MSGFIELFVGVFLIFAISTILYFVIKYAVKNALIEYDEEKDNK